jgi:hypothetical protein
MHFVGISFTIIWKCIIQAAKKYNKNYVILIALLWAVTSCCLVRGEQSFGGIFCFSFQYRNYLFVKKESIQCCSPTNLVSEAIYCTESQPRWSHQEIRPLWTSCGGCRRQTTHIAARPPQRINTDRDGKSNREGREGSVWRKTVKWETRYTLAEDCA